MSKVFIKFLSYLLLSGLSLFFINSSFSQSKQKKSIATFSPSSKTFPFIINELKRAKESVDVGMFYFTHEQIINALCQLGRKKLKVRLFVDEVMAKTSYRPILEKLAKYGVEIYVEKLPKKGKIHLKCAVIDDKTVITGSGNWTKFGFESNIEDFLILRSEKAAEIYRQKFDNIVKNCQFFQASDEKKSTSTKVDDEEKNISKPIVTAPKPIQFLYKNEPEIYFTPGRKGMNKFFEQAKNAQNSVDIAMYLISDGETVRQLVKVAKESKAIFRILVDGTMLGARYRNKLQELSDGGLTVKIINNDKANMHMKSAVIDEKYVWSGSCNWTKSAMGQNLEDMIMIESPELAKQYLKFYDLIEKKAKSYDKQSLSEVSKSYTKKTTTKKERKITLENGLPSTFPRTNFENLNSILPFEPIIYDKVLGVEYLDDVEYLKVLLRLVKEANQSILVALYHFKWGDGKEEDTLNLIVEELEKAVKRGVYVRLLLELPESSQDKHQEYHSRAADKLRKKGIDVRLNMPTVTLDDKLVVVDLCKVLVGSHNWSEGAMDGSSVYESSILFVLPEQDIRLAKYILERKIISHMSSKKKWDDETVFIRHLKSIGKIKRKALFEEKNIVNEPIEETKSQSLIKKIAQSINKKRKVDLLFMRDETVKLGRISGQERGVYSFSERDIKGNSKMLKVPKNEVAFALYSKASNNDRWLKIKNTARLCRSKDGKVELLSSVYFSSRLIEEISKAKKSIHILTYYISGLEGYPIGDIYSILKEKAKKGVDVMIICPFGSRTSEFVKNATIGHAKKLTDYGVNIKFMQDHKSQHKKLVIIDSEKVFLGSSNLTKAGTTETSNNMNAFTNAKRAVDEAQRDFNQMRKKAKDFKKLKY